MGLEKFFGGAGTRVSATGTALRYSLWFSPKPIQGTFS